MAKEDNPGWTRADINLSRIKRAWARFLLPVCLVAIAAAVRSLLPILREAPYIAFFPAVIVSTLYAGVWPGLLAMVLSAITASIWFSPGIPMYFDIPGHAAGMSVFLAINVITVSISGLLLRAQHRITAEAERLRQSERALEAEVAERRRAEESLRESREDLNHAQAVAQTGSWRLSVRRNKLLWSDETYRIFGIPIGTPMTYELFLAAIHPDDREFVDKSWQAAIHGEPYDIEHRIIVGEDMKWVGERAELEFDEQGELLGGFGTVQDITERKALERQKSDFLAMVTHDLKSPLTSILGFSELILARRDAGPDTASMVTTIQHSGQKLLRMVDDFLTISKMEAGSLQMRLVMEDVGNLLMGIEEEFRPLAENKGLTFVIEAGEDIPRTLMDRKYVERAIANLVQNAFNYTPEGGEVKLRAWKENGNIAVSVQDTGTGIPLEEQEKVFDKYYRSPKTSGIKGTGLGLAIVKAVAEAHGGRVDLESEPGRGSNFSIFLPVREAGTPSQKSLPPHNGDRS